MSNWEKIAIGVGLYALGSVISTVYLVTRGSNGLSTFDGITGTESEGVKAAEAIAFWPVALVKAVRS